MNAPLHPTEEQIAAAQLRIELDKKLGRETPEIVREIADHRPTRTHTRHFRPLAEADRSAIDRLAQALERHSDPQDRLEVVANYLGATQQPDLDNLAMMLDRLGHQAQAVNDLKEALSLYRRQHADDPPRRSMEQLEADEPSTSE